MTKLILATTSPHRQKLFSTLGLDFVCEASGVDEDAIEDRPEEPRQLARYLAKLKAEAVANKHSSGIVIGIDTVGQYIGGTTRNPWEETLDKPRTKQEAYERLRNLSGKVHYLFTGIHMINLTSSQAIDDVAGTKIFMRTISDEEIERYFAQNPLFDRTIGYDPEMGYSSTFVERIEGSAQSYFYGMPIERIMPLLFRIGYKLPGKK
jgi:septum formation protein